MKGGSKTVDTPNFAAHTEIVKEFWRLNPDRAEALIEIAEWGLSEELAKVTGGRGVRGRLLSRLQAVHDCDKPTGGGFVQLQPSASGAKSWRCIGCNQIVALEGSQS